MPNRPDPAPRFQFISGSLSLDFVNTVADRLDAGTRQDKLRAPRDLSNWMAAARAALPSEALLPAARPSAAVLRRAIELREVLYRALNALADEQVPAPADLVAFNRVVHGVRGRQKMSPALRGLRWSWDPGLPAFDRFFAAIVIDAAELATSSRAAAITRCDDDRCGWLFLDLSPGHRRRWCSMRDCGNRAKARRHYARSRRA